MIGNESLSVGDRVIVTSGIFRSKVGKVVGHHPAGYVVDFDRAAGYPSIGNSGRVFRGEELELYVGP